MADEIHITETEKERVYEEILPQIRSLLEGETDAVANMANVTAALKMAFPAFSWVGFYLFDGAELILGPFQGKPACVRIAPGRGVCGTAFDKREPVIVQNVHTFPGHIACDAGSLSEIVVPLLDTHTCHGVLDVDSYETGSFDDVDEKHLTSVASMIVPYLRKDEAHGNKAGA